MKHSRKIHILFFIVLLILGTTIGCGKQSVQYGYSPVFRELTWGMSKEEVIDTLQLTNSNAQVLNQENNSAYIVIKLQSQINLFNENAKPHLLITKGDRQNQDNYGYPVNALSAIILKYEDIDTEELTKSMKKVLGKPSNISEKDETKTYTWKSKDKCGDMNKSLRDKMNQYIESMGEDNKEQEESIEQMDNKTFPKRNSAVNKITVTITDETNAVVTYYGDWAVYANLVDQYIK